MKLRKLHIEDYKMFKNFDISFVDEKDKPLPIVILAGVNGSGKTSLLKYLLKIRKGTEFENADEKIEANFFELSQNEELQDLKGDFIGILNGKNTNEYEDDLVYFSTDTSIENVQELMPEYLRKIVWDEDIKASEAFERVRKFANNIFKDIDIKIEFDSRDGEKNLYFRNKSGGDRFLIDKLSTGEKTLISKVLYMYLENIQDKVILIDEPELSLHPSWQNKILKIYENFAIKNNCQIIIATHSPHIIASADNKYIRFLEKEEEGNVTVINNIQAYGRDIEWVLQQMGVKNLRVSEVLEKFTTCQQLLNDENYDEAELCINDLEEEIGQNDRQIMNLRNSLFFERD